MKIFLVDDSNTLGQYLSSIKTEGKDCAIHWVKESYYDSELSVDDFFHKVFIEDAAWEKQDDPDSKYRLISLTGKTYENCLFLVNVNLKINKYSARQYQEGVELLKHIRLTEILGDGRNAHVVLYSFEEQLQLLKRKPGNLIMLSEGVTFFRLPEGLDQIANPAELSTFSNKDNRADVGQKDFKRFVQCDYQPRDAAHAFSNWWGIRQVIRARNALRLHSVKRPSILDENLVRLENKKILFLNDHPDDQIGGSPVPNFAPDLASTFEIVYIDDEEAWGDCLKSALQHDFKGKVNVDYLPPPVLNIISDENKLKDWATEYVLSKANTGNVVTLTNFSGLECAKRIKRSLVLLDLRLLGKDEVDVAVLETSGVKVAKAIRMLDSGLPIILLTASNKTYTFEAAMRVGIDGYWMKEGVGEHALQGGACENYIRLLTMICSALSPEYQFLRRFSQIVSELKDVRVRQWWENYTWQTLSGNEVTKTNKGDICKILNGIVVLLREYLRLFKMGYGFKGEDDAIEQSMLSALIIEAVKILELVHRLDLQPDGNNGFAFLLGGARRKDWWGGLINAQRRHAAHALGGKTSLEFVHAKSVLSGVLTYLVFPPVHSERSNKIWLTNYYDNLHGDTIFYEI